MIANSSRIGERAPASVFKIRCAAASDDRSTANELYSRTSSSS
jgi:hypothetical protein